MIELPTSIRLLFPAAGWSPGRRVAYHPVETDHPARAVLAEFGGLRVGQVWRGEECARSDVDFRLLWPDNAIRVWDQLLAVYLIGVADVHHGHAQPFVDDHCRFFEASSIHDAFYFHGASFGEAMERILLGRRARPMLRPTRSGPRDVVWKGVHI
jgi:hypothetical protein